MHTFLAALTGKEVTRAEVGTLGDFHPIFPQFSDRSFTGLLWELNYLEPDSNEVKTALDAALELSRVFVISNMEMTQPRGEEASQWRLSTSERTKFDSLIQKLDLNRWK